MVNPEPQPTRLAIAAGQPPGIARRRALRAAGINLHIADFTVEEQARRGFQITPRRPLSAD